MATNGPTGKWGNSYSWLFVILFFDDTSLAINDIRIWKIWKETIFELFIFKLAITNNKVKCLGKRPDQPFTER